jgi:hypothetical protein
MMKKKKKKRKKKTPLFLERGREESPWSEGANFHGARTMDVAVFRCPLAREPRELADALARPSRRTSEREIRADPPHVGSTVAVPELGAL